MSKSPIISGYARDFQKAFDTVPHIRLLKKTGGLWNYWKDPRMDQELFDRP